MDDLGNRGAANRNREERRSNTYGVKAVNSILDVSGLEWSSQLKFPEGKALNADGEPE